MCVCSVCVVCVRACVCVCACEREISRGIILASVSTPPPTLEEAAILKVLLHTYNELS